MVSGLCATAARGAYCSCLSLEGYVRLNSPEAHKHWAPQQRVIARRGRLPPNTSFGSRRPTVGSVRLTPSARALWDETRDLSRLRAAAD